MMAHGSMLMAHVPWHSETGSRLNLNLGRTFLGAANLCVALAVVHRFHSNLHTHWIPSKLYESPRGLLTWKPSPLGKLWINEVCGGFQHLPQGLPPSSTGAFHGLQDLAISICGCLLCILWKWLWSFLKLVLHGLRFPWNQNSSH